MKNDIFDFRRFGKYLASDLKACWASFGLSLLTVSLLSFIVLYIISVAMTEIFSNTWSGPDIEFRLFVFGVAMFCLIISMPVKCYGRLTEKQYGSFWLTLPASRVEKVISMLLLTCIIVPTVGTGIYLALDHIVCSIDHTCGESLISGADNFFRQMISFELSDTVQDEIPMQLVSAIHQLTSPLLYIDDLIGITLPFLLGAICFKKSKTVMTFIAIAAFSVAASMISTPIVLHFAENLTAMDPSLAGLRLEKLLQSGIIGNIALWDTVNDTLVNLVMIGCIYFRIKTLKH